MIGDWWDYFAYPNNRSRRCRPRILPGKTWGNRFVGVVVRWTIALEWRRIVNMHWYTVRWRTIEEFVYLWVVWVSFRVGRKDLIRIRRKKVIINIVKVGRRPLVFLCKMHLGRREPLVVWNMIRTCFLPLTYCAVGISRCELQGSLMSLFAACQLPLIRKGPGRGSSAFPNATSDATDLQVIERWIVQHLS